MSFWLLSNSYKQIFRRSFSGAHREHNTCFTQANSLDALLEGSDAIEALDDDAEDDGGLTFGQVATLMMITSGRLKTAIPAMTAARPGFRFTTCATTIERTAQTMSTICGTLFTRNSRKTHIVQTGKPGRYSHGILSTKSGLKSSNSLSTLGDLCTIAGCCIATPTNN